MGAALALIVVSAAYVSGFFYGKKSNEYKELKNKVEALNKREKINEEMQNLDDVGLCLALGGLPDICAKQLRRLGEAAAGE